MSDPFGAPPAADPFGVPATAAGRAAAEDDLFGDPEPKGGRGPRIMDIPGRLVLVRPVKPSEQQPAHPAARKVNPNATVERMTADLVVLDGGSYAYGGKPEDGVAHTLMGEPGTVWRKMWITQTALVNQCQPKYRTARPWTLGRIMKGEKPADGGNAPWVLEPATDADRLIARRWLAANPDDPFGA